jgi:iduronate 2-sulfatase
MQYIFCWPLVFVLVLTSLERMVRAEEPTQSVAKKNVLLIISDDLNNFLGCYGDQRAKTPHIDRLAARGTTFRRAYCTYPLCGPSRNSMLTGLYPNSTGILQNQQIFRQTIPKHLSLPHLFRNNGYFAARIGKLYHYNVPRSIGTNGHDDPASWELEINPAGVDRLEEESKIQSLTPGQFGGTLSWYASTKEGAFHTDGIMARDAQWVLERCAARAERPFFLAVGFYRPHTPFVAPRSPYFDLYPESEMPLLPGIEQARGRVPRAALASYKKEQDKLTDRLRQQVVQAYYASISFMDAQVGYVVDTLDRLGLSDKTVIAFTSDHGYHMGEHGLWQKMSLFEESARVPLLIVAPGVGQGGAVVEAPVSQVDLYPTLAELCSLTGPANLQGQSLVPMLRDSREVGRGWALTQVQRAANARSMDSIEKSALGSAEAKPSERRGAFMGYSLRSPRWRYTQWDEGREGEELYDHDVDPEEQNNLAGDPQYSEVILQLSMQLRAAVASSFPDSGQTPSIELETWAPNLTDP